MRCNNLCIAVFGFNLYLLFLSSSLLMKKHFIRRNPIDYFSKVILRYRFNRFSPVLNKISFSTFLLLIKPTNSEATKNDDGFANIFAY